MDNKHETIKLPDYVLVHPALQRDGIAKQGQIGFITAANVLDDEFYIGFDDGQVGLYAADALLMVREREQIQDYAEAKIGHVSVPEFQAIIQIALLQGYGGDPQKKKALEMAMANPKTQDGTLSTLESFLSPRRDYTQER